MTKPGGRVREPVGIRLGAAADVHIGIRDGYGRYIRRVNLGPLSAGWHYWTWSGFKNGGTLAPDGHYAVTVHATFKESGLTTQDGSGLSCTVATTRGSVASTYDDLPAVHDPARLDNPGSPPRAARSAAYDVPSEPNPHGSEPQ